MVKKSFDILLHEKQLVAAGQIVNEATHAQVTRIINVGTSLVESKNCLALAQKFSHVYAALGIHPNDCTPTWRNDLKELTKLLTTHGDRVVAIGECGIDKHYPDYNLPRQIDAFKAHIELALTHDRALIVHSRDAYDETLSVLQPYKNDITRGVIHCFSEDQAFADTALSFGFVLGIGGPLTYPKNDTLRSVFSTVPLEKIILETDAPFLPPQQLRGKQNHPKNIASIAQYLADLRDVSVQEIARVTTDNAQRIFKIT